MTQPADFVGHALEEVVASARADGQSVRVIAQDGEPPLQHDQASGPHIEVEVVDDIVIAVTPVSTPTPLASAS